MKKIAAIILLVVCISACKQDPYMNVSFRVDEVSNNCSDQKDFFRSHSNIGGEHYEFDACLDKGFDAKECKVNRSNDTLIVVLPQRQSDVSALYNISLEIDTYPGYKHIKVRDHVFDVTTVRN